MLRPADRAGEHLVGIGDAISVMSVVVVGRPPSRAIQRMASPVELQQVRRGHDRVEVVVDRGMVSSAVVIVGGAGCVAIGVRDEIPGADGPVGDVELHRPTAAVGEVEAMVGARRRGECGLLSVDRGDQQPVDAEGPLRRFVNWIEAFHPAGRHSACEYLLDLSDIAHRLARRVGHDRGSPAPSCRLRREDALAGCGIDPAGRRCWRQSPHGNRWRPHAARADQAGEHRCQCASAEQSDQGRKDPAAPLRRRRGDVAVDLRAHCSLGRREGAELLL